MKKIFYFVVVSVMAVFTNLYSRIAYGQVGQGNVFYGTIINRQVTNFKNVSSVMFVLFSFIIPLLSVFAFKNRGRALITFMDKGEKTTKLVKIISKDKEKIVFKDKEKTYTYKRSDIIKIRKKNGAKIILIIAMLFLLLIVVAGNVVDYVTRYDIPDRLNSDFDKTLSDPFYGQGR